MANREQRSNRESKKPKKSKKAPAQQSFTLSSHKPPITPATSNPAPALDNRKK